MADDYEDDDNDADQPVDTGADDNDEGGAGGQETSYQDQPEQPQQMATSPAQGYMSSLDNPQNGNVATPQQTAPGAPIITRGGQAGIGEAAGDTRSRYTATFAGGHQMQVIGGGYGTRQGPGQGMGGPMPPPAPGAPLSRVESNRLQQMQNAVGSIQQAVSEGKLGDAEGGNAIRRLQRMMAPMLKRQSNAMIQQIMQQNKQAQMQLGLQDALMGEHDTHLARTIPNSVGMVPNPTGGAPAEYYRDHKGDLKPTPRQEHQWKMEQIQAQHQAKQGDPEAARRAQEEHERKDYESVAKLLTVPAQKGEMGTNGKWATEPQPAQLPTHEQIMAHIAQRDIGFARTRGPAAEVAAIQKHYPDASKVPPQILARMKELQGIK